MDETQSPQPANPRRLRDMNEQIRARIDAFDPGAASYPIMCECELDACDATIDVAAEEYDRGRTHPDWYVVLPGHVITRTPVETRASHWIVA